MASYKELIDDISAQTGTSFGPAKPADLSALQALGVPRPVLDFFALHEPTECAEGQVRLWPIAELLRENRDYVPGSCVAPFGYIVFATTITGDTYCFDLNNVDATREPPIVLISHEAAGEDVTAEEARRLAKPVAKNLLEFLEKFARQEIDEECVY